VRVQRRESDPGQQLIRRQINFAEAKDKVGQRQCPLPAIQAAQRDRRVERQQRRDRVVGRAGGDDVAGDGGAIANLRCADFPAGARQRERLFNDQCAGDDLIVRDERAEMNPAVACRDGRPDPGMRVRSITPGALPSPRLRTPRSISSSRSVAPARARTSSPYLAFR
jgi:hypothetical protein